MTTYYTRRTGIAAACIVAAGLAGYAGVKYARGSSPSLEMASRIEAAVDAAAPRDTVQLDPRPVRALGQSTSYFDVYGYDYDKLAHMEKAYQDVPRQEFLREVFARAIKGHENDTDNEKWLAVMDYINHTMRHPPVEQPMYPDRTAVWDPLILLELHEGRCGHVASVIVDLALANHYEARRVQLACHLVAEVKWGGSWHWVDADGGIPVDTLRSRFPVLPSLEELARTPHVLDGLAFRNWQWRDDERRTLDGVIVPPYTYYPGELLPSSVYFGQQVFTGVFGGRAAYRQPAIDYCYKEGTPAEWQTDRYYGWDHLRKVKQPIPAVPVDYSPFPFTITGPEAVYLNGSQSTIPVRWTEEGRPVCQPDQVRDCKRVFDQLGFEVRVSSATRGWNYDFRDYKYMPGRGKGDLLVTRNIRKIDAVTYGIDVPVGNATDMYIEVVPVALDQAHRGEFMWPSNEIAVHVVPRNWTAAQR